MNLILLGVAAILAIAVALLVWSLTELGSRWLAEYRERFTRDTHFNLRELFLTTDSTQLFALNIALMLLLALGTWYFTDSLVAAVGTVVLVGFLPPWVFRWLRRRRIDQIEQQMPDALLMLAGTARAGLSLQAAIRQVSLELPAPLSQEFNLIQREQRLGLSLDDSLENLSHRVPVQSVNLMVSAMRIANEAGGSLAETLERASQTLRSQHAMELKIRSLTAQGKLQAWVVGLLPLLLFYILARMEPEAMSVLWTTRMGWGVIAVVLIMEMFGILFIRRIVNIDV
jgi:tight adherence protein B